MQLKPIAECFAQSARLRLRKTLILMKFTTLILLTTALQLAANVNGQTVSLSLKNATLKQAFREIQRQSGLNILVDESLLDNTKKVTAKVKNVRVEEALDECLKKEPLTYLIKDGSILIKAKAASPTANLLHISAAAFNSIKGLVTDETGSPMAGVSIIVKGTKRGASTNNEGLFVIEANVGETLVFKIVGYKVQEIKIDGSSTNLKVSLEPEVANLSDVVVVGYGTQKQVNLTGAVDQISAKVLENRPITRLSQGLQGVMAGLNILSNTGGGAPNSTQSINIRGYTGLGTTGGPLVVIDGVQGGDINSINPNDVESIAILKDAASAAIYGSSAPYGVLLITTKKGKRGEKASITYNNNFNWAQPINLPKMMNSLDFATIYNEAFANAGRGVAFSDVTMQRIKDYQSGAFPYETTKNITPGIDGWNSWFEGNANNDFFKIYFKNLSFSQQHTVGVSGGSNNSTYYIGGGYNQRSGLYNYGDDSYKRYNIRANLSSEITKWMTVGLRSSLARAINNTPNTYGNRTGGNYMHQIARKFPTVPLYNPDGNYSETSDVLLHLNGGRLIQTQDDAVITGELNLKPLKGWEIVGNYTFDGVFFNQSNHTKTVFHTLPSGMLSPIGGSTPNAFGRFYSRNEHKILNLYSSYALDLGDHHMKVLGGYVNEITGYTAFSASNTNLYSDEIPSLNTTYNPTAAIGDEMRELAIEGFFGRINYNYKEKYLLEFNGRYDGTSKFLSQKRWKFYPGVSAGWNIDKEAFWTGIAKVVNTFKLRGSYGSLGDQSSISSWYPFYPALGTVRPTGSNWLFGTNQEAYVGAPSLVNPNFTWVTTTSFGLGFDATFFNNRLSTRFDWFKRSAKDYAGLAIILPSVLGTGVPPANNASIENKGFELTLQWKDNIGDLNYSVRGTLSDYVGKVVSYDNPNKLFARTWWNGAKMGDIWGYTSDGLYQNAAEAAKGLPTLFWTGRWQAGDVRYVDLDGSGKIDQGKQTADDSGDYKVIGNNTPRYMYGLGIDLNWKNFDFSLFLQGVAKRDVWIGSNYFWGIVGDEWQSSPFTVHANRWSEGNPGGYFPRFYMNGENGKNQVTQTRYLQNAAYMRIKNLQIGYTLPTKIASRAFLQRARIYFSVDNLATFTKLQKTFDPELALSDAKIYPLSRTYSCGVNFTF